jgi:hypothetical protein
MNALHMVFGIDLAGEGLLTVPATEVFGPVDAIVLDPFMTTCKELVRHIASLEDAHVWLEISEEMFPVRISLTFRLLGTRMNRESSRPGSNAFHIHNNKA